MNESVARDVRTIKFLAFGTFLIVLGHATQLELLVLPGALAGVLGVIGQYVDILK